MKMALSSAMAIRSALDCMSLSRGWAPDGRYEGSARQPGHEGSCDVVGGCGQGVAQGTRARAHAEGGADVPNDGQRGGRGRQPLQQPVAVAVGGWLVRP